MFEPNFLLKMAYQATCAVRSSFPVLCGLSKVVVLKLDFFVLYVND